VIAPLREPSRERGGTKSAAALRRARRLVAAALLSSRESDAVRQVVSWKAWLFALWVIVVCTYYVVTVLAWKA
jgi:hypothetical protein